MSRERNWFSTRHHHSVCKCPKIKQPKKKLWNLNSESEVFPSGAKKMKTAMQKYIYPEIILKILSKSLASWYSMRVHVHTHTHTHTHTPTRIHTHAHAVHVKLAIFPAGELGYITCIFLHPVSCVWSTEFSLISICPSGCSNKVI